MYSKSNRAVAGLRNGPRGKYHRKRRALEDVAMLVIFSVMVSLCGADSLLVVDSLLYAHQIHQMYI